MSQRSNCHKCRKLLVDPIGSPSADYLIAGEFPEFEELRSGKPMVGKVGDILTSELAIAGLSVGRFRITNLWLHAVNEKECDPAWHLDQLSKELKGKKAALLMGSELSKALFQRSILELSGLEMKHAAFPKLRMFFSPSPAALFHGPVGEMRLAMHRFAAAVR